MKHANSKTVEVSPRYFTYAFRNPLKGFRGKRDDWKYGKYTTLIKHYIKWNEIEDSESDGVEKIRDFCDTAWYGYEKENIKVIPRVYLEWPNHGDSDKVTATFKYWPSDMTPGDYSSDLFKCRVVKLIKKLGEAWDNDPRVAYIEMGIIGFWGEHHHPDISPELQKIMGDAFVESFKNKLIMVRHAWEFQSYPFGYYWDSFAHLNEEHHAVEFISRKDFWKHAVLGGETAYNWGDYQIQPGDSPDDTLTDPVHMDYIMTRIRNVHANHLGWISDYSLTDKRVLKSADEMQKALGYRFVIRKVAYNAEVCPGDELSISFEVENIGSSPFYYNWPVEASLLDNNRKPVWKDTFKNVGIRTWMPGSDWDEGKKEYKTPAPVITVSDTFTLPEDLPEGKYILALSILDPGGNVPAVRFAIENYFKGGRHPIGRVGIGCSITDHEIDNELFDSLKNDDSLGYVYKR